MGLPASELQDIVVDKLGIAEKYETINRTILGFDMEELRGTTPKNVVYSIALTRLNGTPETLTREQYQEVYGFAHSILRPGMYLDIDRYHHPTNRTLPKMIKRLEKEMKRSGI